MPHPNLTWNDHIDVIFLSANENRPFSKKIYLSPRALGSPLGYSKIHHPHNIVYQGTIANIGVHKGIQMSIYLGKGVLTCLLSNVVKKVGVRGCISW